MTLDGKTALAAGGSRGIGAAIATRLAAEAASVVIGCARDTGAASDVIAAITASGRRAIAVLTDVRSPEQVHHPFAEAIAAYGGVDIVVAIAGIELNAVIPGAARNAGVCTGSGDTDLSVVDLTARTPLALLDTLADTAAVAALLAGHDAGFITGQQLVVDGGAAILCQPTSSPPTRSSTRPRTCCAATAQPRPPSSTSPVR